MSASFFRVSVSGEETLTEDLHDFLLQLKEPIRAGLSMTADGFTRSLDKHIENDVYEAYQPKRYPRRAYNESLMAPQYKEIQIHDLSLLFQYEPKGFHRGKMKDMLGAEWDANIHKWVVMDPETHSIVTEIDDPNAPIKPKPVHGDALIRRIQTGKGYDWDPPKGKDDFPERPFWNNFIEEQRNGAAFQSFAYGFGNGTVPLIPEGGNRDMEWSGDEGMLESGFIDDEQYELPF